MRKVRTAQGWAVATVAAALLSSACSGSSSEATSPTSSTVATSTAAAASAASSSTPASTAPATTAAPTTAAPPTAATTASATTAAPTTAPPTTAAQTTAAPTTTAPAGPVVDPTGKFAKDPAVLALRVWLTAADQAYLRLEGSYPPLVALSTATQNSFTVADLNRHKALGDHQKGLTRLVVVGVKTVNVSHRTVQACQDMRTGYWVTSTGARRDKLTATFEPDTVALVKQDNVWKVDVVSNGTFSCKGVA